MLFASRWSKERGGEELCGGQFYFSRGKTSLLGGKRIHQCCPPSSTPSHWFHFAKGETHALAKLTYRQHFPEVIGSVLIFIWFCIQRLWQASLLWCSVPRSPRPPHNINPTFSCYLKYHSDIKLKKKTFLSSLVCYFCLPPILTRTTRTVLSLHRFGLRLIWCVCTCVAEAWHFNCPSNQIGREAVWKVGEWWGVRGCSRGFADQPLPWWTTSVKTTKVTTADLQCCGTSK